MVQHARADANGDANGDGDGDRDDDRHIGSGRSALTALAAYDRDIADLIAINASLGLDIDASTARTRWAGDRLDHSHAIEAMYFEKHGQL